MSDERLRDTQRLARLGDLDAQARELGLRVRAGSLRSDALELLAHVGHAPACLALGLPPPRLPEDLEGWVTALRRWGRPIEVAAATAAARLVLEAFEEARPGDPRPRRALEAAEAWLDSGPADPDDVPSLLDGAATAGREAVPHTVQRAAWACYHAAAAAYGWEPSQLSQAGQAAFEASLVLRDPARLRDTIRDRIVAWVEIS